MKRRRMLGVVVLVCAATALALAPQERQATPVATIPFEWVTRHILVKVEVNNSRPLPFVLDTGASPTIIKLDRAKQLGLNLHGEVQGGGAGGGMTIGSRVNGATLTIPGVPKFSTPLKLALPLARLAPAFGQDVDGIIGGEFIRHFVVEIDHEARRITLHDQKKFRYTGSGEALPIQFNSDGHPFVQAQVTLAGGKPITGDFLLDTGSGGALVLHTPFVDQHRLLESPSATIRAIGAAGAGGEISGRIGRVAEIKLGRFAIPSPTTLFAQDRAGAFANPRLAGNIGGQILSRFRVFLDYAQNRIILEPTGRVEEPFDRAFCGCSLRAEGANYKTFRVRYLLENSPATEAGLQIDDVITAINGKPTTELALSELNEMLEKPVPYELSIRRGERVLKITLTPRKLI